MIRCIYAAVEHWRCAVGVNFVLDTFNKVSFFNADDSVNCISINSFTQVMGTQRFIPYNCTACNNPNSNYSFSPYVTNFDIVISEDLVNDSSFYYDETGLDNIPWSKYDFYSAILHELGHAIGLRHVNQPDDLMWFQADINGLSPNQRKVKSGYWNQEAGKQVVFYSSDMALAGYSCPSYLYEMIPVPIGDSCRAWPLSVELIYDQGEFDVRIYPNPFDHQIVVEIDKPENVMYLDVSTIMGQKIMTMPIMGTKETLQLDNLPSGIYILSIYNSNKCLSKQLLKQ